MRLIDADLLLLALDKRKTYELADGRNRAYGKGVRDAMKDVDEQPTVDAVEVVHGHWEYIGGYGYQYRCSNCIKCVEHKTAFCPHCGAKMDKEGTV